MLISRTSLRRREFVIHTAGAAAALSVFRPRAGHAQQDDRVRALQIQILRMQVETMQAQVVQFIREIESQIGWTTQLPWSASTIDQRRFDGLRLLRQVPAITELAQLDSTGKEQLRVSRLAMSPAPTNHTDYSGDPKFTEAVAKKVHYGPVYFRESGSIPEPYMTLSLAGTRREAGVSVAEVNLKLLSDLVANLKVGQRGIAYILDGRDRIIAHPDVGLLQRDVSALEQVQSARTGSAREAVQPAKDMQSRDVLAAYSVITPLGWLVLVDLPAEKTNAP
jgi:hypothetical protein